MIPLKDSNPSSRWPGVNYALIGLCVLVFLFEISLEKYQLGKLINAYGFVPARFLYNLYQGPGAWLDLWPPLLTAMFLHGGGLHLIFNMWTLFIFGDNVEDFMGHGRYLALYLLCGLAGFLGHLVFAPASKIPTIGASGAIAGVMGAYFYLYPQARILTFIPPFFIFPMPAYLFLGLWFLLQFLSGTFRAMGPQAGMGGVAFWAHVGGFAAGVLILLLVAPIRPQPPFRGRRAL